MLPAWTDIGWAASSWPCGSAAAGARKTSPSRLGCRVRASPGRSVAGATSCGWATSKEWRRRSRRGSTCASGRTGRASIDCSTPSTPLLSTPSSDDFEPPAGSSSPRSRSTSTGERGSIDVLAWHPASRTLLVVEIKSAVGDIQATLMTLDRKVRLAPIVARRFGWEILRTARLLVVGEGRTNRRVVEQHGAIFASAFPVRGRAAGAWLRQPSAAVSGLLFLSNDAYSGIKRRRRVRRRPQRPVSRSDHCSGTAANQAERA